MSSLFSLFIENIFPIIVVAGIGFLLQRQFGIDPKPLSVTIFNALTPALIFRLIIENNGTGIDSFKTVGLVFGVVLILTLISYSITRALKLPAGTASGFFLAVAFMNAGNYGLSLNQFALGETGLAWASIFYITHVMLMNSLGVFLASAGRMSVSAALRGLLRIPALYAFGLALFFRYTGTAAPTALLKPVGLLADATIPAMLLVLGMQISRAGLPQNKGLLAIATSTRLIFSPTLAWIFTRVLNLSEVSTQSAIIEAGMPSAVLAIIISMEYDTDPGFVSSAVLFSTLLSPITLTIILALLGL